MFKNVSVVGLGKLGMCLAACIADRGVAVTGVDVSSRTIQLVNEGISPIAEPGLAELVSANRARLRAMHDYAEAIGNSQATFVVVPTPSDADGKFSLRYLAEAAREIGAALAGTNRYHLVVIVSTVLPGSIAHGIVPILEGRSGKRCGSDFGLCYSPEFIALGEVIRGLRRPDFILIGESDPDAGGLLEQWYRFFCENDPPCRRMNFVNAELTKIAVNTFVTTKISFANMLAEICERLPGADVDTVTGALGLDTRIGPRYLNGAVGYGGPCFPRDNQALAYLARNLSCTAELPEATDRANRLIPARIAQIVHSRLAPGRRVGVLGLSYKPNTNVVEESQGIAIARELLRSGRSVSVFDRHGLDNARLVLKDRVSYTDSARQCIDQSDGVVITNPDREFRDLRPDDFPRRSERPVVFDAWRILRSRLEECEWVDYVPLGVGGQRDGAAPGLARVWAPGN
jgi:UDPglucose 6-dehydrogenase